MQKFVSKFGFLMAAALLALAAPASSRASGIFDYTTSINLPSPTTVNIGGGATLAFTPVNGTGQNALLPGGTSINLVNFTFSKGTNTSAIAYSVNFDVDVTFDDNGDTQVVNYKGVVSGTHIGTGAQGGISFTFKNFAATPTAFSLDGTSYTIGFLDTNAAAGSTSGTITTQVAAVPEPASLALVGLGGLGIVGAYRRRRARA